MTKSPDPPDNADDQSDTIDALADELHLPVQRVTNTYTTELARLRSGATLHDYLPILACRKVRDIFRKEASQKRVGSEIDTKQAARAAISRRRSTAMFAWGRRMGSALRRFAHQP